VKRLWYQRLWYQRLIKVKSRTTPDAQEEQEYNKKYGFDRMKKETGKMNYSTLNVHKREKTC
jgi:hypothetical protein